CQQYNNLPRTF
nr:immunoglobulin light chain junction region [Macaca mulatta]MOX25827.1 immunoglobulin light chain junction region [Macaca mulatta]MPN95295.1 immunoglobulin light chain junction region [Macaca mulatta]MPO01068.1 immunoglobulin light chain junction region [Macaca mulatta]